ncbi:MAG: META domain-containing protein, partial [Anaerolineales bacterium]|nr:META domain-containing protein [Anaerolineales bacterium]
MNYNKGNQAVVGMITGSEVTLNFGADGQVSGSAGCNRYTGPYQSEGGNLKVGELATSRMMCPSPEGVMEQETRYLAALQNAATYSIWRDTSPYSTPTGAPLAAAGTSPYGDAGRVGNPATNYYYVMTAVNACGASTPDRLSARWNVSAPGSSITLYRYAIGTAPGA